ncbi:hypothetical protein H6F67_17320 [Microcoleus sp. FACHB-1515]|uniref:hypothetical protein n=1 Tax=Cyanophyceae TaxID=3028117 RepID=UPI001684CBBF|nr:hypothetical protein [Microcoleus sp. FACHB-1515]MBD2091606.1 hypothetical protein [Microcoleus sp. FACHB-1515]
MLINEWRSPGNLSIQQEVIFVNALSAISEDAKVMHLVQRIFWSSAILGATIALVQLPVLSQRSFPNPSDLDNIYHEDENLSDDADVFPRIGRIAGAEHEQTNCRVAPWGRVVALFAGNSFVEIDRRQVDRNGESWFHQVDRNCWIHDRRIDLL